MRDPEVRQFVNRMKKKTLWHVMEPQGWYALCGYQPQMGTSTPLPPSTLSRIELKCKGCKRKLSLLSDE